MRSIEEITRGELIEEIEIRSALSFKFFRLRVLGRPDHSKFHDDITAMIEKFHRIVIELPRQHTKSSTICDYLLWKGYFNRGLNILFLSHGLEGAKANLVIVTDMIEDNQLLLKKLAPEDRKFSWSKTEIKLKTGCKFTAKANNRRVKGGAYDYVFPDEVGEYEDKGNYFEVVEPTINTKQGKIIAAGTPQTKFDLLNDLKKNPLYASYSRPCHFENDKGEQVPLWGYKYTMKMPTDPKQYLIDEEGIVKTSLPALKRMYEAAGKMSKWWTEMMVTPISDEASVFPDEKIMDCCDETESFEDYGDKRFNYVHGNDFALSQAAQADYNAWFVGKLLGNKIKIANIYYKLGVEERTKDEFVKWYFRYGGKCVMDNSNFGRVWLPEFVKQGIKAEGYDFKSKGQTREELLQTIKDALFSKRLIFPRSFNDTRAKVFIDALIEELRSFREEYNDKNGKIEWVCTGRHDDLVIGLGLMIKAADQGKGRVGFTFADL